MKAYQVIHRVALVALIIVAAENIYGSFSQPVGGSGMHLFTLSLGLAMWGFLFWKVATRPRQWGIGLGIYFLLLIAFQTYLFRLALAHPSPALHGFRATWSYFLLFDELPILIVSVSCFLLRFMYPLPASDPVQQP